MSYDPDFILTVGGQNVTQYVMNWALSLPDNDSCSLTFSLENQNSQLAGAVRVNDQVNFCFGYTGRMSEMLTLDILSVAPEFNTGTKIIKVTAYDEFHKLCGDCLKGCFKKGTDTVGIAESVIKSKTSYSPNVDMKSPKFPPDHRPVAPGLNSFQTIKLYSDMSYTDKNPEISNSIYTDKGGVPDNFSGTNDGGWKTAAKQGTARIDSRNPDSTNQDKDNTIDQNRNRNANKNQNSNTVTAKLALMGYPELRPSLGVTVLNVDEYSGEWYCNHVNHKWDGKNLTTDASVQRGEIEKQEGGGRGGKSKAPNPMIIGSDPFKKEIYVGPRKTDAPSQATFTYGVGEEVVSFHPHVNTQKKGATQKVGSEGPLMDAVNKRTNNSASNTKPSGSSGSSGSAPSLYPGMTPTGK
jgi:hypothetical protein